MTHNFCRYTKGYAKIIPMAKKSLQIVRSSFFLSIFPFISFLLSLPSSTTTHLFTFLNKQRTLFTFFNKQCTFLPSSSTTHLFTFLNNHLFTFLNSTTHLFTFLNKQRTPLCLILCENFFQTFF